MESPHSKKRTFILLRYVLIAAGAYLLLWGERDLQLGAVLALVVVAALASNIGLAALPEKRLFSIPVVLAVVVADITWVSAGVLATDHVGPDLVLLYLLVMFATAAGESLLLLAGTAVLAGMAYMAALGAVSPPEPVWTTPHLMRLPFLFTAALACGYLVDELKSQRRRAENATRLVGELERVDRLKSDFLSAMSHEIRTPLTVILGYTEMMRDPSLSASDRQAVLRRIDEAGRDFARLIDSVLAIGRLEAGRDEVTPEPVHLPTWWAEVRQSCARMPRDREVTLEWSDRVPAIVLVTDPGKLTVVLRNLVGNALKFTERGWVRAQAEVEADKVVLRVCDSGVGIRPEDQRRVFEMFRQGDGDGSRHVGGVGLGLYIVQRFVEQLGGTIMVESSPGCGSVFTVRLPHTPVAAPSRAAAVAMGPAG